MMVRLRIILISLVFFAAYAGLAYCGGGNKDKADPFEIGPWKVGQYAVYQVVSIENDSLDNRYRFSLTGKERIDNVTYFWMETEISEGAGGKARLLFRALVPEVTEEQFREAPAKFISGGFLSFGAKRLLVKFEGGDFYEEDPASFFSSSQDIVEDSLYRFSPDNKGRVDFTKLRVSGKRSYVFAGGKKIKTFHFYVKNDPDAGINSEGVDIWRSPDVPFLGLVKMKFSKTLYWLQYKKIHAHESFFKKLFTKIVPGRERPDVYTVNLIDYGMVEKK
jgi:hypothetical protein